MTLMGSSARTIRDPIKTSYPKTYQEVHGIETTPAPTSHDKEGNRIYKHSEKARNDILEEIKVLSEGKGFGELDEAISDDIRYKLNRYELTTPEYLLADPPRVNSLKDSSKRLNELYVKIGVKDDPNKPVEPGAFDVALHQGGTLAKDIHSTVTGVQNIEQNLETMEDDDSDILDKTQAGISAVKGVGNLASLSDKVTKLDVGHKLSDAITNVDKSLPGLTDGAKTVGYGEGSGMLDKATEKVADLSGDIVKKIGFEKAGDAIKATGSALPVAQAVNMVQGIKELSSTDSQVVRHDDQKIATALKVTSAAVEGGAMIAGATTASTAVASATAGAAAAGTATGAAAAAGTALASIGPVGWAALAIAGVGMAFGILGGKDRKRGGGRGGMRR